MNLFFLNQHYCMHLHMHVYDIVYLFYINLHTYEYTSKILCKMKSTEKPNLVQNIFRYQILNIAHILPVPLKDTLCVCV